MKTFIKTTTIVLLFLVSTPLHAVFAEEKSPWQTELEAGYSLNTGNTKTQQLFTALSVERITNKDELSIYLDSQLKKTDSKTSEENMKGVLNYDRLWYKNISLFGLYIAYKDQFQKLYLRSDLGGGLKYIFTTPESVKFSTSGAFLYEYEHFSTNIGTKEGVRFSLRPKIKWKITNDIVFSSVWYYQPKVDALADYRVNTTTSFTISSVSGIGIRSSLLYRYNNKPEKDVEKTDISLITSFILSF